MPYPEKVSTAEMVHYIVQAEVQALWSYGYMKMAFSGSVKWVCCPPALAVLGHTAHFHCFSVIILL